MPSAIFTIMIKITIIGTGSVGSTIAYTLAVTEAAAEIVMIDINQEKALGEAMDIRQGLPFCAPCSIYAGTYRDAVDSDVIIFTCGIARKRGQSRLDLAQTNVDVARSIIPEITRYAPNANYIIVSNPVDILTYTFHKCSDLPSNRIIGSGTILDTARLRTRLSEYYSINQQNVHAYVMGEHGDSSFIPWSVANISNIPVDDYSTSVSGMEHYCPILNHTDIETYVKKSGANVIERKGATYYAVSIATCYIVRCLLGTINTTMTVSSMMNGEYGVDDVCLSVLCAVNRDGINGKLHVPLTDPEVAKLRHSADCLKQVIHSIDFKKKI